MEDAAPRTRVLDNLWLPLVALETLTVLRLRHAAIVPADVFGRGQAFFPAVGLLLGGLLAGAGWLLRDELGPGLTGWLLAALLLILTGGLHADGLADTADGLFGGHSPQRRLAIMRDSAIGAFGAAALIAVVGIKATALGHAGRRLAGRGADSRPGAVSLGLRRRDRGVSGGPRRRTRRIVSRGRVALGRAAGRRNRPGRRGGRPWVPRAPPPGRSPAPPGLRLGAAIASRLGGLTGDTFGAIIEVVETLLLVIAVAWAG